MSEITIVIADDHPIFREGIRRVLEKDARMKIGGEAEDGETAFTLVSTMKPDVAILDFQMPGMTGLEVARRLEATGSETRVILLTMIDDKRIVLEAMELGVAGYVLKDSAVSEIIHAVKAVVDGRPFVSPTLAGVLLQKRSASQNPDPPKILKDLTATELRILKLISDLKSNKEIADELFISQRTVENHRVNMAKKLNLKGSHALLKTALENKAAL